MVASLIGVCAAQTREAGAGMWTGRTPCLPGWVPVTVCDREHVEVVLTAHIRLGAGPPASLFDGVSVLAGEGVGRESVEKESTPATVQVRARYQEDLPG